MIFTVAHHNSPIKACVNTDGGGGGAAAVAASAPFRQVYIIIY